jgi:hypothetical protein
MSLSEAVLGTCTRKERYNETHVAVLVTTMFASHRRRSESRLGLFLTYTQCLVEFGGIDLTAGSTSSTSSSSAAAATTAVGVRKVLKGVASKKHSVAVHKVSRKGRSKSKR